jgi:hypothetical protein
VPAAPGVSNHSSLPGLHKVHTAPVNGFGLSPRRHRDLPVLASPTVPVRPFPVLPPATPEVLAPLQRRQIPLRRITNEHHIPPVPAIATIRPTPRHMSLAPKADAAVPASPALNPDFGLVVHEI